MIKYVSCFARRWLALPALMLGVSVLAGPAAFSQGISPTGCGVKRRRRSHQLKATCTMLVSWSPAGLCPRARPLKGRLRRTPPRRCLKAPLTRLALSAWRQLQTQLPRRVI